MRKLLRRSRTTFRCPLCESDVQAFEPFRRRLEARCPHCGCMERHRAAWLVIERHTDLLTGHQRVLHFAPEAALERRLRTISTLDYVTCDITPGRADRVIDAQAIDLPDGSIDVLLCTHVLEHVPDDRLAMRELRRVLAPGGWAILDVPILVERTDEDPSVVDPSERLARFGQEDHVRAYGPDYFDRLAEAGFVVETVDVRADRSADELARFGVHYKVEGTDVTSEQVFQVPICRPAQ